MLPVDNHQTKEARRPPQPFSCCLRQIPFVYYIYKHQHLCASCIRNHLPRPPTGSVQAVHHQHLLIVNPTWRDRYCNKCFVTELLQQSPTSDCGRCASEVSHFFASRQSTQRKLIHFELRETRPVSRFLQETYV